MNASLSKRWIAVVAALLFLNFIVTFENVWPTPAIRWDWELSLELAVLLLALASANARFGPTSPRMLRLLAGVVVLFALGRYADVTAPALYGREINLYWDLPNIGSVAAMLARAAPMWIIAAAALVLVSVLASLYAGALWSLTRVDRALRSPRTRRVLGCAAAACIALFIAQSAFERWPEVPRFATPVSHTYAMQAKRVFDTLAISPAARALPPSPPFQSDLGALANRDVLLVFVESYGRVTYDRPDVAREVAPAREQLAEAARRTGRSVVSAFVTSPTFGGGSWLAHSSLMSGIDIADPDRYALLLTQDRPTLASFFKQHGYRVVADMPGTRGRWPEGSFYRFDALYDAARLDYHGPAFGWWRIPDQFSLASLDAHEIRPQPRRPVFVLFPTINTHMPFRPTPPLQSDWNRVLGATPFDALDVRRSVTQTPAWTDMGGSYAASLRYSFEMFASYLAAREDENMVLILIGDHQPAANVSGEGASWDVPVHVITRAPEVIESLERHGFVAGTTPAARSIGRMNEVGPILLDAFATPRMQRTAAQRSRAPALANRAPGASRRPRGS
ncbi:MAG TPA: sulfatase-like hydrolase/transferase [Steroidobacteraceae bacterium]|nr:sulfatase-like hydrolase/transferase [Steroidobacteraceae bacterium]